MSFLISLVVFPPDSVSSALPATRSKKVGNMVKTVQVNFVVNTVLIKYYDYYEIYLNSL